MALFELEHNGMRKFYRVERDGTRVELHWGRIGSKGQRKVIACASEAEAKKAYDVEVQRRHEHGYVPVRNERVPRDAAAARAKAASDRLGAAVALTTAPRFMFVRAARKAFVWLERRGAELWSATGKIGDEAKAAPTMRAFASDAAAERACNKHMAELLGSGYVLEAFDAAKAKTKKEPGTGTGAKAKAKPAKAKPLGFRGERWALFGEFAVWPRYHGGLPEEVAQRRGAVIVDDVGLADVVVIGDLRGSGRADAKKRAERRVASGEPLHVLDEAAFRELVRIDLSGKRFAFIGGFDCSPSGLEDGLLARMVERVGGVVHAEVDDTLDYLVIGNRRGPSKIALQHKADKLAADGARLVQLDESSFLELVRVDTPAAAGDALDFAGFIGQLYGHVEEKKLGRALVMLRKDRFQLYAKLDDDRLVGVVSSQTGSGSVYASWLTSEGLYGCSQSTLEDCMGLQGAPCKHLMVLVVGLARTNQLPMPRALDWMRNVRGRGPRTDNALGAETFIQYKGATAGEIDWRPTETIPEDFYAV